MFASYFGDTTICCEYSSGIHSHYFWSWHKSEDSLIDLFVVMLCSCLCCSLQNATTIIEDRFLSGLGCQSESFLVARERKTV